MYRLLFCIFWLISLLPSWLLYGISDVACFILYHLMGYRKEVVRSNLQHAFPTKSSDEIEGIMRRFYRSFCDQWIETVMLMTMSRRRLERRISGNWEVLQTLAAEGRNAYVLAGHTFNWEWANVAVALHTPHLYACVYLPVSNPAFDRLMLHIRTRISGAVMISMKGLIGGFRQLAGKQYSITLAADQNPAVTEVAEWLPFMHREAPFFRGPEQMPRRARAAVVLVGVRKIERGRYEVHLEKLCDDASQMPEGSILKSYVAFVEQQMEAQPENWLWSHRRWKHQRKV